VIADYVEVIDIVTPLATPRVIQEDADDDHVIAAAVAAEAAVIVSGDRHLLIVGTHKTIRILQAAQVLAVLDAQPP
jgi:predicted nucleic acid-binding protein